MASLANYNFQSYYRAGKTNIDTYVLLRVSWPGCIPKTSDTHQKVTVAAVHAMQEATFEGPVSPIKVYSCDLWILDSVEDSLQVTCLTIGDWWHAQQADPVLGHVIARG